MAAPVLTAPIGVLGLVHPDADLALTRAAAALGLTSVLSTVSSTTLEEAAAAFEQVLVLRPEDHGAAYNLAWTRTLMRDGPGGRVAVQLPFAAVVTTAAWLKALELFAGAV